MQSTSEPKIVTVDELTAIYDHRIQDGMKWLDDNVPGWEPNIDLDDLNLSSATFCVVGQTERGLYEPIRAVLEASEHASPYPVDLGFEIDDAHDVEGWYAQSYYNLLTDRWIVAIGARRSIQARLL
jgi:hypothetical protein